MLRSAYHAIRAIPELRDPRVLVRRLASLGECMRFRLALFCCSDPHSRERMRNAASCWSRPDFDSLSFPAVDSPQVSIVIPVYNQFWKTLECLQSIAAAPDGPRFELIVVDDRSSDRTARVLSKIPGIFTLRNDRRRGHVASCNRGAVAARGEYLVFLNQDALVTPGWLGSLARTFSDVPGTGLAGAKLVRPDGRLLEAGAALWRDATAWGYGEKDDVNHPWYNFCSARSTIGGAAA